MSRPPPRSTLFPYTTLFRSCRSCTPVRVTSAHRRAGAARRAPAEDRGAFDTPRRAAPASATRSEEHTSELQSHHDLVCRLLLEKKKHKLTIMRHHHRHTASV